MSARGTGSASGGRLSLPAETPGPRVGEMVRSPWVAWTRQGVSKTTELREARLKAVSSKAWLSCCSAPLSGVSVPQPLPSQVDDGICSAMTMLFQHSVQLGCSLLPQLWLLSSETRREWCRFQCTFCSLSAYSCSSQNTLLVSIYWFLCLHSHFLQRR